MDNVGIIRYKFSVLRYTRNIQTVYLGFDIVYPGVSTIKLGSKIGDVPVKVDIGRLKCRDIALECRDGAIKFGILGLKCRDVALECRDGAIKF